MLHAAGIDRGETGNREISVNIFSGVPVLGMAPPIVGQFVALPSSGLTFRRMFLPNASKSLRQQVMVEELSYSLPFPLTEAHFGAVEMGDEAWVTVAADSVVQPIKILYPKANLEAEPLCYMRAAKAAGVQHALVVDFGATKTVFCGVENGQVGTVRVMLRGGESLTEELAKELDLPKPEAELLKREEGIEHPTVRRFFTELTEEALLPSPLPYRRVFLCGGGSATKGLLRHLGKIWGDDVDVEPFPLPGLLMPTEHVVAFGAALAGRPKATKLQMQHSFSHAAGGADRIAVLPLVFTAILMSLMVLGTETRLAGAEGRVTELRGSLNQALQPVLKDAANLPEEQMIKALEDRLRTQLEAAKSSPAKVMNTLGQGADAVIDKKDAQLFSVRFEDEKLKLEGRATSLKQSEDIRTALEKVLVGVEQVKTRPTTGNAFIFQIEGQLPES